ncbi:hypothetical protein BC829DRAFT_384236, partial [Chytridium lagenaria]
MATNSKDFLVQFHTANTLKDVFALTYTLHTRETNKAIYDLPEGTQHALVTKFGHCIAIVIKRSWLDWSDEERADFFNIVYSLREKSPHLAHISLIIIEELLHQFTSDEAALGLPWNFHFLCENRLRFESELSRIFQLALQSLHALSQSDSITTSYLEKKLALHYSKLILTVFTWNFVERGSLKNCDDDEGGWFPASWAPILVNKDLVDMFFHVHTLLQDSDSSGTTGKNIFQLAGLLFYLDHLIKNLSTLIAASTAFDADGDFADELLTISKTIKRCLSTFPVRILPQCENLALFLNHTASLTLRCLQQVKEDPSAVFETGTVDALEILLEAWATVVLDIEEGNFDTSAPFISLLKAQGYPIFQSFLESKLILVERDVDLEEGEIDDRDDSALYADQLLYMGILGRLTPDLSLQYIYSRLVDKVSELQKFLQEGVNYDESDAQAQLRESLYEHLHWLVLFSGHILADSGEGEIPLIPKPLLNLSETMVSNDFLVEIPSTIFRLWNLVTVEPKSTTFFLCSPLLAETILWFTQRWMRTYLLITPSDYSKLSSSIIQSYAESGNGFNICDIVFEGLVNTFIMWDSQEKVLQALMALIDVISSRSALRTQFLNSTALTNLLNTFFGSLTRIPANLHSSMVRTLASLVTSSENRDAQSNFFAGLFDILKRELRSVVGHTQVKFTIMNTMDLYEGLALAANSINERQLAPAIKEDIPLLLTVLETYKTSPDVFIVFLRLQHAFSKLLVLEEGASPDIYIFIMNIYQAFVDSYATVPRLCVDYLHLLSEVSQRKCGNLMLLSPDLFCYFSDCSIPEAQRYAFEIISCISRYVLRRGVDNDHMGSLLDQILQHVMNCILFRELDLQLVDSIGEAFFALVLSRQVKYRNLVESLLSQQDAPSRERLSQSFGELDQAITEAGHKIRTDVLQRDDTPL